MSLDLSFRFANEKLNKRLIARLESASIRHKVDRNGSIRYSSNDESFVENELIGEIRTSIFRSWQILSCPPDWVDRYIAYLTRHDLPYVEEWIDEQKCLLLPRHLRPHRWKLPILSPVNRLITAKAAARHG